MLGLFDFLGQIITPITSLIDNLTTTDKEKLELKNKLQQINNLYNSKVLEYQSNIARYQEKIIVSEATGRSWLQRNWRPILMFAITLILINNYIIFPYLHIYYPSIIILTLPTGLWTLLTAGVSGYILGRSGEKIVQNLKNKGRL